MEYTLDQNEIHRFGEAILRDIHSGFGNLVMDADNIWTLDSNIALLSKITKLVVGLQCDRKMIIDDAKSIKEEQKE